ncbi:MAG TPA: hypothetical protein VFK02_10080 [Kofleriaceae bacterium]|nr:hypothetical protein [Kofleriaceae bacterium]
MAGVGLFALVGCNQIFGINPTRAYDAAIDVPPDQPHVLLNGQIATVLPPGPSGGGPDPTLAFVAIDPAPKLRISLLDPPTDSPELGELQPVDYQTSLEQEAGAILIPRGYRTQPWRLEYTLTDNVPHEVQWLPADKQGHLTVPVFGRLMRSQPPSGSGYTITPGNPPASYSGPRVFTTGQWTEGAVIPVPAPPTIVYSFDNALALAGANGRPEPAMGDLALVADYASESACRVAVGSAPIDPAMLTEGALTAVSTTWNANRESVIVDPVTGTDVLTRLNDRLGNLGKLDMTESWLLFGSAAHASMPGLTAARTSAALGRLRLPTPVMVSLLQCPAATTPLPMTAQPTVLDGFPRVLHVQLVAPRTALGIQLVSGIETVLEASAAAAASSGFKMAFPAPFPTQIELATPGAGVVALDGPDEQVAIGPASGAFVLRFQPELGAGLRADYHDVVLHKISGGALTTERIYTVTQPTVRIDGALLVPGADYVLEIRTYKGHPRAAQGDFAAVDYPYGATIVFTRTFKAS